MSSVLRRITSFWKTGRSETPESGENTMGKQKHFDQGPGLTNSETTDAAAEAGADHNEAIAQRPGDGSDTSGEQSDQAAIETLQRQSDASAHLVMQGQTTTTTPDSVTGESAETQSVGDLDQQSAEQRLEKVRGWASQNRLGGPSSATWEELDQILKSGDANVARRP